MIPFVIKKLAEWQESKFAFMADNEMSEWNICDELTYQLLYGKHETIVVISSEDSLDAIRRTVSRQAKMSFYPTIDLAPDNRYVIGYELGRNEIRFAGIGSNIKGITINRLYLKEGIPIQADDVMPMISAGALVSWFDGYAMAEHEHVAEPKAAPVVETKEEPVVSNEFTPNDLKLVNMVRRRAELTERIRKIETEAAGFKAELAIINTQLKKELGL